jgi:hypothetical protein
VTQAWLLLDDHHVLYRSGTRRVLHPPTRHAANPLVEPTEPWETALAWNSVYHDPVSGRYQLWYQSWLADDLGDRRYGCVVCYAESDDGVHFDKPRFTQFPYGEHTETNIVLIGSGGHSYRYCCSVLVEPEEPDPARRYRMAYFDWTETDAGQRPGLCVAFSPDGIHWTKHPKAPLSPIHYGALGQDVPRTTETERPWSVPLSMSDGTDVFFDPVRRVYAWYGKMWLDGPEGHSAWKHAMGRTESSDFLNWSTPELVCAPDDDDLPHVEFHTTPVFFHEGVYICLNQILDRAAGGGVIDVELMLSRDGFTWQRPFRDSFFLPRGASGSFEGGSIFTNSTPVILDTQMRFYYGGYSAGATSSDNSLHTSGIGVATLPRDRFAGITPLELTDVPTQRNPVRHVGQVTMKKCNLSQYQRLELNADAEGGSIRVEVLDAAGRRVPGFLQEDAVAITGDALRHRVYWQDHELGDLPDGEYMLRLHLDGATVFAIYPVA